MGQLGWRDWISTYSSTLYTRESTHLQQLFRPQYSPDYRLPFFVCLGVNVFAFFAYLGYRYLLLAANKRRAAKIGAMTQDEINEEIVDAVRVGDKKYTFVYTT